MGDTPFTSQIDMDLPEIMLVGICARTNNTNESNPKKAKISQTIARFWANNVSEKIQHRSTPGRIFAVYTDYESDEHGDYTYFYGEQVDSLDNTPDGLDTLKIPASHYRQFTTQAGPMPNIIIQAWQHIWKMPTTKLAGERRYQADFEVYDERATDPQNSVVDVFIGVKT